MNKKLTLSIELIENLDPFFWPDINISGNFNTEHILFEKLADHLGGEHFTNRDQTRYNLSLLEKLEILCNKAREHIKVNCECNEDYYEIKAVHWNDKIFLENKNPVDFYDEIMCIDTDLYLVFDDNQYGLITSTKKILPVKYIWIERICKKFVTAQNAEGVQIYNLIGELLLDNLEEAKEHFNPFGDHKDYIWAKREGKWGLFDPDLKPLIPFRLEYDSCDILHSRNRDDLYIKVYKDGKCGLINGVLNIDIVPLEEEIEDIYYNVTKEYVITFKADHPDLNFTKNDILGIEAKIKSQN